MSIKRLLIEKCVPFLGSVLLRSVYSTLRWYRIAEDSPEAGWLANKNEPCVLAFWHGDQLMMPFAFNREAGKGSLPVHVLISEHRDGRLIARAIRHMGIDSVAGSSSNRGKEAFWELVTKFQEGSHVAITPDGPKGPRHKAKAGIVRLAQETNQWIQPMAIYAERVWEFKSWDRMFLPKPFSRAILVLGEKIEIPENMEFETLLERVDTEMERVAQRARDFNYDENKEFLWR